MYRTVVANNAAFSRLYKRMKNSDPTPYVYTSHYYRALVVISNNNLYDNSVLIDFFFQGKK